MWTILGVVALVVVVVLLWLAGSYNSLVALRNRFKAAFSQIDVQLKRRHDLIPNLVETAKGYLSHEKGTLEAVTQARGAAVTAARAAASNPGNASAMAGLAATENQIAAARQIFNNTVMNYNTTRESFPTNLVANAMGFAPAQLFELEVEKERQVPQVSF